MSLRRVVVPFVMLAMAGPTVAAPDPAVATRLFAEAHAICTRDHGRLWGKSLCGPMLLVDYTDQAVLANQADQDGRLEPAGAMFRGFLPDDVIIANTPTQWSGTRWTQIVGPVPDATANRRVLVAHELFHRIQPSLGLTRPEAGNAHLDTLEGRYLLQLEWRALARALETTAPAKRDAAVLDALAFRRERYRLFAGAASEEADLEVAEGVPEYTGVKLGLATRREQTAFALHDLAAFVAAPTFVRSFAYATGPAYGLLLDQADPGWRGKLQSRRRLDELLADGLRLEVPADATIPQRAARYDDGTLRASEMRRDEEKRARLASFKARLVDGPVLAVPLVSSNYQFNPQTVVPLNGFGTVYPTMRLTDVWGALEVERGGALVQIKSRVATVTASSIDSTNTSGDGWRLVLKPGWKVAKGDRPGDLVVVEVDRP